MNNLSLSNGVQIPIICYGTDIALTWRNNNNSFCRRALQIRQYAGLIKHFNIRKIKYDIKYEQMIKKAVYYGCEMFDTSSAYGGSENGLGNALKSIEREKVFIVTKISNSDQRTIGARASLMNSLKQLGVNYVDLYLIHWPQTNTWIQCWKEIEQLYKENLCRSIGVCNCNIHHLEELKKYAEIMPMVNQIECHPLFVQKGLKAYCESNNIQIMAYTATGRNDFRLKASRRLESICKKYNKTLSQIILRWHIQQKVIPIFNTGNIEHLKSNLSIFDFELTEDDLNIISSLNINARLRYDPDNCEFDRL